MTQSPSKRLPSLESYGESRVISIATLPMFGLHHTLTAGIPSFLSKRSIVIRFENFPSKLHSINSGVPQGSFISPVLSVAISKNFSKGATP